MRLTRNPTCAADIIAIAAMVIAILAIVWARVELYGTSDIEDALGGDAAATTTLTAEHEAVVRNRWVVGFSQ